MWVALQRRSVDIVPLLIEHGADLNLQDNVKYH